MKGLDLSALENWLWEAACAIRGPVDAPEFKDYILIDALRYFAKGRPKNYLTEEHIERIAKVYHEWTAEEGLSAIITNEEAGRNDYNLSPSRYVAVDEREEVLPLEEAVVLLQGAEEERAAADR